MKINIRKAIAEDYSVLIGLFDEIDVIHRDNLPHLFQKPIGPVRELDYYLGLISDESTAVLIAEMDGKIVGFVHAFARTAPDFPILVPRHFAIVDSIVVKVEYQKQGIGRRLLEAIEEWSKRKGASSIELNVYEFNEEAITFYEGLGYKTFSRRLSKELE
jgi:ribosomal protein S18 acetylase RimI-like enzyme